MLLLVHLEYINLHSCLPYSFDTLSSVGANSLILEHDPATVANLQHQVGQSFMTSREMKKDLLG